MKKRLTSLLCGLLLAGTAVANADTITLSTQSFGVTPTNWDNTFSFSKFDTSLGTLTSIGFHLSGSAQGTIGLENTSTTSTGTISGTMGATISVVNPLNPLATLVLILPTQTITYNGVPVFDGNDDKGGTSGFTSAANTGNFSNSGSTTDALLLAYFSGLGSVNVPTKARANNSTSGDTGNMSSQITTNAEESLYITYNYTAPSTVPEPGTFLLLGAGLLGAGAFLRMRKKQ